MFGYDAAGSRGGDPAEIYFPDEAPKDISFHDVSGRRIASWNSLSGPTVQLSIGRLAMGAYWVWVSDGTNIKAKQLIIH
jgi:hypothetical protein